MQHMLLQHHRDAARCSVVERDTHIFSTRSAASSCVNIHGGSLILRNICTYTQQLCSSQLPCSKMAHFAVACTPGKPTNSLGSSPKMSSGRRPLRTTCSINVHMCTPSAHPQQSPSMVRALMPVTNHRSVQTPGMVIITIQLSVRIYHMSY
jgi:hypothetical protein